MGLDGRTEDCTVQDSEVIIVVIIVVTKFKN